MREMSVQEKIFLFSVEGVNYAIPNRDLEEIITRDRVTPLPRVNPFILGAAQYGSRIIPVIDLKRMLGHRPGPGPAGKINIVVINFNNRPVGIAVDRIIDLLELPPPVIRKVSVRGFHTAIEGLGRAADTPFFLLNTEGILTNRKAYDRTVQDIILRKAGIKEN